MNVGRVAASVSRFAFVVFGVLAAAVGLILLFMLGLTAGDQPAPAGVSSATAGMHIRVPLIISSVTYLLMFPVLPLTLVRRLGAVLGILAIVLSLAGLAAGLLLWVWNPYLDWRWPVGLLFASAVTALAGAGAIHHDDGWVWSVGLAVLGLILLAVAALYMNLLRG